MCRSPGSHLPHAGPGGLQCFRLTETSFISKSSLDREVWLLQAGILPPPAFTTRLLQAGEDRDTSVPSPLQLLPARRKRHQPSAPAALQSTSWHVRAGHLQERENKKNCEFWVMGEVLRSEWGWGGRGSRGHRWVSRQIFPPPSPVPAGFNYDFDFTKTRSFHLPCRAPSPSRSHIIHLVPAEVLSPSR